MGKGLAALGAVLVLGGGGALGYALTRKPAPAEMTPEQSSAMGAAVAQLDGSLREAHSIARTRAGTLATLKPLVEGVKTGDMATVEDQVANPKGGELKFELKDGEVIEIGTVAGDAFTLLVRQPKTGKPTGRGGKPAASAVLEGERVVVYEIAPVKDGDAQVGYVTVAQPLELKPALDKVAAAGIAGRFELGEQRADIGGGPPAGAETQTMKLAEPGAQIVVAKPAPVGGIPMPIVGAGAGAAGLGLLLAIIGLFAGKRREPEAQPPSRLGETRLSLQHPVAAGTPSPVDASASSSLINPHNIGAGAMIGRWEVIRRLGSGGMADVYLAHAKGEAGFEKLVAIKVMHSHLARNERAVDHFLDEARLAARIHHPNVVQILDLGKIGNDYVIVMEYVEGVDLERLLASARAAQRLVPVEVGLALLCRICDGLHAAHTATGPDGAPLGLIHRDVKSANVLVSKQGIVKVVDFGIAKATAQSHLTMAGETKGTPSMMAPEQRVGELVDVRADVYSVAAVGYEILTGHGVNLDLAALAHLGVDNWPHLPPPSSLRAQLPAELDALLLTAMAFERERRPDSCQVFEAQVEAVMKQHGLVASDKDIARWVAGELAQLVPAFEGASSGISRPAGMS